VAPRPDPRAEVKAFAALALDLARVEPQRRPGPHVQRWYLELAEILHTSPRRLRTNADLVFAAIVLRRLAQELPPPAPRRLTAGGRPPKATAANAAG
jgi:hypothetical protein